MVAEGGGRERNKADRWKDRTTEREKDTVRYDTRNHILTHTHLPTVRPRIPYHTRKKFISWCNLFLIPKPITCNVLNKDCCLLQMEETHWRLSSCLHRASSVSKTLFIVQTDAHYYKIIEMLEQFKIITLAPTCFGSRRNHHQGALLWLAKTTVWFFRARRYRRSQCYGGISSCCAGVRLNEKPYCSFS